MWLHSCFFQLLRQLRSIKQSLTSKATRRLVHSFITRRLDYCNSVFAGVSGHLLHRMQVIQNAAAHLVTGAMKYQRMPQVLRSLHWLPVRQQITFKTTVTVGLYKCLAPPYLTEHIRCWPPTPTICQHAPARHPTSEDKLR